MAKRSRRRRQRSLAGSGHTLERLPREDSPQTGRPAATVPESGGSGWRQLWQDHGWTACVLFALALFVRLLVLFQLFRTPYAELANIDTEAYQNLAREILNGYWIPTRVWYQSPLYSYFLAIVYWLFGTHTWVPRVIQVLMGSLSVVFVYGIGAQLFSRRAGLIGAALLCLYGPIILEEVVLLKTALVIFTALLSLLLLLSYGPTGNVPGVLVAGLLMGITGIGAGQWLAALPFLAASAGVILGSGPARRRVSLAAVFFGGCLLPIVPVAAWNTHSGGGLLLTSADSGINLYFGNNPRALGLPTRPDGLRDTPKYEEADSRRIAEQETGRPLTPAEVSRYWTGRALSFIDREPGQFAGRLARKFAVFWNSYEVADNYHYPFMRSEFLPFLRGCIGFAVVGPLALMAMIVLLPRWRPLLPLYLGCLAYVGSLLLFYVRGRYRLAVAPLLIVFAAAGADWMVERLRRRSWAGAVVGGVLLLGSTLFVNREYCEPAHDDMAPICLGGELWFSGEYHKLAYWLQNKGTPGDEDQALVYFRKALEFPSRTRGQLYFSMGSLEVKKGEYSAKAGDREEAARHLRRAEEAFQQAIRLKHRVPESYDNLASVYRSMGDPSRAVSSLENAVHMAPNNVTVLLSLGRLYVQVGRCADGRDVLRRVVELSPQYSESMRQLVERCSSQQSLVEAPGGAAVGGLAERQRAALVSALATQPAGTPVWFAVDEQDTAAHDLGRALQAAFTEAGWLVRGVRAVPFTWRSGVFLFAADERPPAYVQTAQEALRLAGLPPMLATGYRSYYAAMTRTKPGWRGFEMAPDQTYLVVIGPAAPRP